MLRRNCGSRAETIRPPRQHAVGSAQEGLRLEHQRLPASLQGNGHLDAPAKDPNSSPATSLEATDPSEKTSFEPLTTALDSGWPLRGYLLTCALATIGITAIWGGVASIIIPLHVQQLVFTQWFAGADSHLDLHRLYSLRDDAAEGLVVTAEQRRQLELLAGFDVARARSLSVVAAIGVLTTMLLQPVVGTLSDRTRSAWGRRGPWIAAGAMSGGLFLVAARYSTSLGLLIVTWTLAQLTINAAQGPLTATVADRVLPNKIGWASAVAGFASFLGVGIGAVAAGGLFARIGLDVYYIFALVLVALPLMFVLLIRDRSVATQPLLPFGWSKILPSFMTPLRDSDFRWLWIAKVVMMFGFGTQSAFIVYMLQSYIRPSLDTVAAARIAPLITLAALPGALTAMLVAGWMSDKTGRRKPFVIGSSLVLALSMLLPFGWPTLPALFAAAVIGAIAIGAYVAVDQALFIDVLPDQNAAGRDLGMGALGGNLGQAIGPIVAGQVVAFTGGYRMVWLVAFVVVVIAAVAVVPIRRAR